MGLAALAALQAGRTALAVLAALLTIGLSPLAFVFLCLVLAAFLVVRRPAGRRVAAVGAGLAAAAGLELAVLLLFPAGGRYEFRTRELAFALLAAVIGAAVAAQSRRGRPLAAFFLLFGLACIVAYFIPSPLGSNITRLRIFVLPLVLLGAALSAFRPRWLALPAVLAAGFYSLSPFSVVATQLDDTAAKASYWAPALAFLQEHGSPEYRVDVVPTFDNWEAWYLPRAGEALARGWYRQLDLARNPQLYRERLEPTDYRRWLRSLGVRFVLLPDVELDRLGAEAQATLLRSGRSGLREVLRGGGWRVFELPAATPILTGPAAAGLTALGHDRIAGTVAGAGDYRLRVRYTRYFEVRSGPVCLARATDGMTLLRATGAGPFELRIASGRDLLAALAGSPQGACPASSSAQNR